MEALRGRFGKYHVLEKIAQGGMAEVYKVKTVGIAGFEKVQALKRILPASAREGRFIRSFIDEARIAVELTHRNIVQVFDFGKADGELFLAMELIEGKDLRTAMAQAATCSLPPPIPVAAYIIAEIAAGLDYAHRKTDLYGGSLGIVHCDVSPSNVMLSTDGYVKILDFGIARATFASALERRRLRGKPRYMAPEQTRGEPPTAAVDVFALGIIAWELFTGMPLYRGATLEAILDAVRTTLPPRVDHVNPHVPADIANAVAVALLREPKARGTAAELATACARSSLEAGARALASWLAELEARAAGGAPRRVEDAATGVQRGSSAVHGAPPAPHALGVGTPGFDRARPDDTATRPSLSRFLDPTMVATAVSGARGDELLPREALAGEDVTLHGAPPLEIPDETRHDALAADPADAPAPTAQDGDPDDERIDEPIDDEPSTPPSGALAERRRIVVVAAQLAEGGAHRLRPLCKTLGELAYQRGGVVLAQDDHSLLVAFGLEIAGEDDVSIAMGWALDAGALVRDATDEPGAAATSVVLRIGARAGVLTTTGPDGAARIPPDAADEARALAREASPERPLFAGGAGRLTTGLYAVREVLAPRRVARRSKVLEVVGVRPAEDRDRERLQRRGAFVGRAAELAELVAWFQRAIASERRLVALVRGPAGTGKTRLVAELVARCAALGSPLRVVPIIASPAHHLALFSLVVELYQVALGLPPARGRRARHVLAQRLHDVLARAGVPPERRRVAVLDLDRAMELRDGTGVGAPDVADLRPRIAAGLALFRTALADRARPLLTIVEDVHLGDRASLEVLRHVLAVPQAGPELLVLTTRPDGPTPPAADLVVSLGDLVGDERHALVADRLGEAATPARIATVLARGGGNPLFIEELARAVREAGSATDAGVPASARDVVAARIDRLSPTAKAAVRFAAVLGDPVRIRLLEELVDETLGAELDELGRAGLLVRGSDGELQFTRGLVREVAYGSLSARAQRDMHARIGRLLASRFFAGREELPAEIAEHLERGGELAGAAAFWLRAGRLALAAADADAATACFARTLAVERELGPTPPTPTSRARRRGAVAGREEAQRLRGERERVTLRSHEPR